MENEVRDPYEYEVDLRDYIKVIWEKKWLIALIFIIAVGAALGFSLTSTPEYRTQTSLIFTSSIADQLVNQPGETQNAVDFISEFDHEEVAFSDELLESIIADHELTNSSGETRSLSSLKNQMSINLIFPGNSNNNTGKPLLTLTVTGSNRERIRKIADKWAELYRQRASEILAGEIKRFHELVSDEYTQVQEELQEKIEERIEARAEHNPELLKIEVNVLRNRYKDYFSSLDPKKLYLEKKRAELRRLNSIMEDEPKYLYLDRSISPDDVQNENKPTEEGSGEGASDMEERNNKAENADQKVNETFLAFKLDTDIKVSSLEKELDYLSSELVELKSRVNTTQATIDRAKSELEELDREINQLRDTSDSLYSTLLKARKASEENGTIRQLNGGNSIETIDSVNTRQNVAVAGVLGLFIGVLVALFKNYMEGYGDEPSEEETGESEDQE